MASELGAPAHVTKEWIKHYKEAEKTGEAKRFDYWHENSRTKVFLSATVNFIGRSQEGHSRFSYVVQDITYLKSVETELLKIRSDLQKENEERAMKFQSLANSIPQLAWMTDGSGYISWYNQRWFDYTGTTLEEMRGWGWEKVHHPDHTKRVTEKWLKHLESGEPWEDTFPLKGKDGEYRWFLSRAQPTYDHSGKIVHWFGTNTDITEEREALANAHEAEAELSRSKSQLEAIFQAMSDGISLFDKNFNLIYLNEAQAKINGFSHVEEMKKNLEYFSRVYELRGLDDIVVEVKDWPISRVLRGESVFDLRLKGTRKDTGKQWYFSFSGEPIRDRHGVIILGLIITRDITIETKAQRSLQQSQNLTKTITDNAASCLFMMDKDGHPSFMNPAAKRVTGYESIEEIKGKPLHYAVHWKKRDGSHYPIEECPIDNAQTELKEIRNGEEIFCRKDGTLFPVSFSVSPLEENGEVIGSVLEFRDITEEKMAKDALQDALRARDEFLSVASHELKTPLTSLMMQAQMHKRLIDRGEASAFEKLRVEGLVNQTERLARKLNRLVEDMLDISRIRSGKLTIQKEPCDLELITLDVLNRFKNQFAETEYKEPVYRGENVVGNWDILRIEQVITNLVSNAIKYGGGTRVTIVVEDLGSTAQLKVCDEGVGISKIDLARIFDRFERAINPNEASGLGLGLFISNEIVKAHGGEISVDSEPGQGSTFIVKLPKKDNWQGQ